MGVIFGNVSCCLNARALVNVFFPSSTTGLRYCPLRGLGAKLSLFALTVRHRLEQGRIPDINLYVLLALVPQNNRFLSPNALACGGGLEYASPTAQARGFDAPFFSPKARVSGEYDSPRREPGFRNRGYASPLSGESGYNDFVSAYRFEAG